MTDMQMPKVNVLNLSRFHASYNLDLSIATPRVDNREAWSELQDTIMGAVERFLDRVEGSEAS